MWRVSITTVLNEKNENGLFLLLYILYVWFGSKKVNKYLAFFNYVMYV